MPACAARKTCQKVLNLSVEILYFSSPRGFKNPAGAVWHNGAVWQSLKGQGFCCLKYKPIKKDRKDRTEDMKGTIELETGRLRLRRYRPEDAALLYHYLGTDEKMYEFSGWNPYASPEMAESSVRGFIDSYENPSFHGWAIELKENSSFIFAGTVGAYDYDPDAGTIEVGLSVRRDLWGRGIAGESLRAVIHYLTRVEKIPCVRAWCAAPNTGSKKAMEKAGMYQTSVEKEGLRVGGAVYDKFNYEYTGKKDGEKAAGKSASDAADLTFRMEGGTFNYRVGAIIIHKGKILLMHNDEEPYYYTVGGRVHFNETTEETVVREVKEEIGVDLEIDRFLFFQEQFFDGKVTGTHIHELGVYYLMKDSPALDHLECRSVTARGAAEELLWVPVEETGEYYIVPESIAARLRSLPSHPEHIIEIDER